MAMLAIAPGYRSGGVRADRSEKDWTGACSGGGGLATAHGDGWVLRHVKLANQRTSSK